MVVFSVKATAHFEDDLGAAYRYYLRQAGRKSASKFLDEYDLTISRLKVMPTAAVRVGEADLHWCPIGSFIAIFSVDSDAGEVMLERLLYMSSDWRQRILGGEDVDEL